LLPSIVAVNCCRQLLPSIVAVNCCRQLLPSIVAVPRLTSQEFFLDFSDCVVKMAAPTLSNGNVGAAISRMLENRTTAVFPSARQDRRVQDALISAVNFCGQFLRSQKFKSFPQKFFLDFSAWVAKMAASALSNGNADAAI
jgi:hypothetical protein